MKRTRQRKMEWKLAGNRFELLRKGVGTLSVLSIALAWALARPSVGTYELQPARVTAAMYLYFFPLAAGLARAGFLLSFRLGIGSVALSVPMGSALLALACFALASLGLLGVSLAWIFFAGAAALQLAWFLPRPGRALSDLNFQPRGMAEWGAAGAPLAFAICVALLSLYPRTMQDVNAYHLYAPARWWESGRHFFAPEAVTLLYASYWDYIHLPAFAFFSEKFGSGHMAVLTLAQLAHATLGFAGSLALGYSIFLEAGIARVWALALAPSLGLFGAISWAAWYGKNDWGVTLWMLAGARLLASRAGARAGFLFYFAAGAFHGLAAGAKMSMLSLPAAFVPAVWLWLGGRAAAAYAAGVGAGLLPVLARNFVHTGNPFFPLSLGPFRNVLDTPSRLASTGLLPPFYKFSELGIAGYLELFLKAFVRLCFLEPSLPVAILLFLFILAKRGKKIPAGIKLLGAAALLNLSLLAWISPHTVLQQEHAARLLAPSFLLTRLFVLASLALLAAVVFGPARGKKVPVTVAWGWLVLVPLVPWDFAFDFLRAPNSGTLARSYWQAATCRAWIMEEAAKRGEAPPATLSFSDDCLFLASSSRELAAFLNPVADSILFASPPPREALGRFAALGYRYFVHIPVVPGGTYYYAYQRNFDPWVEKERVPRKFQGRDCSVIDLVENFGATMQ